MELTSAWTNLASALACLDRIEAFLLREKREDYRTLTTSSDKGSFTTRDSALRPDEASEKLEKPSAAIIRVRGADLGWKAGVPILRGVDMDVMPGELTLIVGPVASGKSTLLKALLGEARMFAGSIEFTIPSDIAYCDQDAWLLNRTVKENILAFEPYNEEFYNTVVQACQLVEDIEQLPKKDDTLIGSKGVSLSGGQKQRVVSMSPGHGINRQGGSGMADMCLQALARAVYNQRPVVILDDVLKGLDADTYAKCFSAILGPEGLLRRNRTAVILATHNSKAPSGPRPHRV